MRLWKKAVALTLAAASLAGGLAVASLAGVALPVAKTQPAYADWNRHDVVLGGDVLVLDDEVINRRNKRCSHPLNATGWAQLPSRSTTQLVDKDNKCGNEVRVEIHLTAVLEGAGQNDPARWCVRGEARLYEGTSDTSNDLDGTRAIPQRCGAPGQTLVWPTDTVHNTDEGGDWGRYNVRVALS